MRALGPHHCRNTASISTADTEPKALGWCGKRSTLPIKEEVSGQCGVLGGSSQRAHVSPGRGLSLKDSVTRGSPSWEKGRSHQCPGQSLNKVASTAVSSRISLFDHCLPTAPQKRHLPHFFLLLPTPVEQLLMFNSSLITLSYHDNGDE